MKIGDFKVKDFVEVLSGISEVQDMPIQDMAFGGGCIIFELYNKDANENVRVAIDRETGEIKERP